MKTFFWDFIKFGAYFTGWTAIFAATGIGAWVGIQALKATGIFRGKTGA